MDNKENFKKYRVRLAKIGMIKAGLIALICGFFVMGAVALITWFCKLTLAAVLIICIGSGAIVAAIIAPILYFKRFYPTDQRIAKLLDRLGLEERIVTMNEYCNENSNIASLQREDAKAKLSNISEKRFFLKLSLKTVALLVISVLVATGFTALSALAAEGVIKNGTEITEEEKDHGHNEKEEEVFFTISYIVGLGEGHIEGEAVQTVVKGGNTKPVTAIPSEGFIFYAWTDETGQKVLGVDDMRMEFKVNADMTICALFIPAPQQGEEEKGGGNQPGKNEAEGGNGGEEERPGGNNGNSSGAGSGNQGAGSGGSGEQSGEGGDVMENNGTTSAGQREDNSVIDGKQNYKDSFDREQKEKELAEDDTIPEELEDILGDYYEALDP